MPYAEALRNTLNEKVFADGFRPLVSLVTLDGPGAKSIIERTVFDPNLSLTADQFGLLIFLELQAMKATKEVVPFARGNSESLVGSADYGEKA